MKLVLVRTVKICFVVALRKKSLNVARGMGEADKVKFFKETTVEDTILSVGVQETKPTSYGADWLNNISGRNNFSWVCVPSVGLSGGIMLGVDSDCFEVMEAESGDFHARMTV